MICKEYECIFIHIPKVAGQSIERFFLDLVGLTWKSRAPLLLRYNPDPQLGPEALAHLTAPEYVACGHINQDDFNRYYKFCFVRNPWDRIVSEYNYRRYSKKYDFKHYLLNCLPEPGLSDAYRHIMPQYKYIFDDNGNQLVDYIGRYERLQEDFDVVCENLQIIESKLPKTNPARKHGVEALMYSLKCMLTRQDSYIKSKNHYTDYYDSESKELVYQTYKRDIETFGYAFE